jgi:hypothetical protein
MAKHSFFPRLLVLAATLLLFSVFLAPALAIDAPKITIVPSWRPGATLDSIDLGTPNQLDVGDDFRYVDAEIYVTTSVPFWAVQMTCTVSAAALTSYETPNNADTDPGNDVEPVLWGNAWGPTNEYTAVVDPFNPATGARTFTATRLGNVSPVGSNGVTTTFLLATLRYRVKDITTPSATSPFNCTSTFLNKNGNPVLPTTTFTAPPNLNIFTGYTISGSIGYQARTKPTGISVQCDGPDDVDPAPEITIPVSPTDGKFSYSGVRSQGQFTCYYYGHTVSAGPGYAPDIYLAGKTFFNLTGQSYGLLPVTLYGGNLSRNGTDTDQDPTFGHEDEKINGLDLFEVTTHWNQTSAAGDINGDGKTDKADLAILASNYNGSELIDSRHMLFSLPRDFDFTQNSRIWVGPVWAGSVTPFVPGPAAPNKGRDLWPALSPDGKTLAFTRDLGTNNVGLYLAPVNNGVVGTPARLTPANATYSAFAPSWSPDGTRLAFVCSWFDDGSPGTLGNDARATGFLADQGDLCVIDANGRNFKNFTPKSGDAKARIYPPAWISNQELAYGGASDSEKVKNSVCSDTICYLNLQLNYSSKADGSSPDDFLAGGSGTTQGADMPVYRNGVLFYRFSDGTAQNPNTRVIRWADISDGTVPTYTPWASVATPQFHTDLVYNNGVPVATNVDYFTVGQNSWDIIFYGPGGNSWTRALFKGGTLAGLPTLEWNAPLPSNSVDDTVGNPAAPDTEFDPNTDNDASYLAAWRNTVDWVP